MIVNGYSKSTTKTFFTGNRNVTIHHIDQLFWHRQAASRMALKRNSKSLISLDKVIATMYQTGKDMNKKYRETSLGGLALIHLAHPCE